MPASVPSPPPRGAVERRTHAYVLSVAAAALLATVVSSRGQEITRADLGLAAILAAAAAIAQIFVVVTPLNQSYHLTPGIVLAAALLLPPPLVAFVVVCQHGPEWIKLRYPWLIQTFNIANFTLAAMLAAMLFDGIRKGWPEGGNTEVGFFVAGAAAALLFVGVQHLLLSVVLYVARGHSFAQSGLFSFTSLSIDFVLTALGVVVAALWSTNRALIVLALSPLFLVHRALAVPKLEAEVRQDAKTELYNARHLSEVLDEEVERAVRLGRPLSLLVADLDLLREFNNRYGHLAGDAVLNGVARVLKENVRPGDVAARFGGEEFCVLLVDTTPAEAAEIAERIRGEIAAAEVDVDTATEPLRATVSIGVAGLPDHAQTARDLLHCADVAVYRAKAHGRNRVVTFGATLDPSTPPTMPERTDATASIASTAADAPPPVPQPRRVASPPPTPNHLAPDRRVAVFAGLVAAAGLLLGVIGAVLGSADDLVGLAALIAIVAVAHAVSLEAVDRGTISVSAVGSLAGAAAFGTRAALPLAIAVCLAELVVGRRQSGQQLAFNVGALTLGGLAAALVYEQLPTSLWAYALTSVAAGVVYFIANIGLLSCVISLETREPWLGLMRTRFAWLFAYYAIYGVVAAMLAIAYDLEGIVGILVFAAPLVLVRKAQADYIQHTEESAAKLRDAAATIEAQNETLRHANTLLRQRATDAMESLAAAIDSRDTYTAGHSRRVQEIAVALAEELELQRADVDAVSFAALFHDVGKLGVPDVVLLKDGPLDDDDWGSIHRHPEEGARIIAHLGFLAGSIPAIRSHHERFDGGGYPDGLRGEEIPIAARILHVADAVDSMLSARPYRPALTLDYALTELRAGSGIQFCPRCVAALERVVARGGLRSTFAEITVRASDAATPTHVV